MALTKWQRRRRTEQTKDRSDARAIPVTCAGARLRPSRERERSGSEEREAVGGGPTEKLAFEGLAGGVADRKISLRRAIRRVADRKIGPRKASRRGGRPKNRPSKGHPEGGDVAGWPSKGHPEGGRSKNRPSKGHPDGGDAAGWPSKGPSGRWRRRRLAFEGLCRRVATSSVGFRRGH